MSRPAVRGRLFAWVRSLALLLVLLGLWKCGWKFGPAWWPVPGGTAPALFPVHARLILATGLAYPRALEATVPAPAEGSNATIQLKLMGLRDGAGWTMKALQAGRVDGKDLKVRAGVLALHSIAVVGPRQILGGAETCKVEYRVRWELPEGDREIWEVKSLVDLRPPKGMEAAAPGQELRRQTLLVYRSWHWELADGSSREIGRRDAARWAWLTWLI